MYNTSLFHFISIFFKSRLQACSRKNKRNNKMSNSGQDPAPIPSLNSDLRQNLEQVPNPGPNGNIVSATLLWIKKRLNNNVFILEIIHTKKLTKIYFVCHTGINKFLLSYFLGAWRKTDSESGSTNSNCLSHVSIFVVT